MLFRDVLSSRKTRIAVVIVPMLTAAWWGTRGLHASSQQGTWTLVHEQQAVGKYEDFAFPTAQHGWLASSGLGILHTADSGKTWSIQAGEIRGLRSIDFIDEKRGFAGTISGQLYGTTDGGATWNNITSMLPKSTLGFCGITHVGEQVHIVGKYTGGAADYFYSPDAGKTWRVTDLKDLAQGLVDVSFINENVGFIGGMAKAGAAGQGPAGILKTSDGGKNWRLVFQHSGGRGFAWKIFPMSPQLIYASLQSQDGIYRMVRSTDLGEHWDTLTIDKGQPEGLGVQGIGFINESTGWIGGFFGRLYETRDAGKTWRMVSAGMGTLNRFERAGGTLFTAGAKGILRYNPTAGEMR